MIRRSPDRRSRVRLGPFRLSTNPARHHADGECLPVSAHFLRVTCQFLCVPCALAVRGGALPTFFSFAHNKPGKIEALGTDGNETPCWRMAASCSQRASEDSPREKSRALRASSTIEMKCHCGESSPSRAKEPFARLEGDPEVAQNQSTLAKKTVAHASGSDCVGAVAVPCARKRFSVG